MGRSATSVLLFWVCGLGLLLMDCYFSSGCHCWLMECGCGCHGPEVSAAPNVLCGHDIHTVEACVCVCTCMCAHPPMEVLY